GPRRSPRISSLSRCGSDAGSPVRSATGARLPPTVGCPCRCASPRSPPAALLFLHHAAPAPPPLSLLHAPAAPPPLLPTRSGSRAASPGDPFGRRIPVLHLPGNAPRRPCGRAGRLFPLHSCPARIAPPSVLLHEGSRAPRHDRRCRLHPPDQWPLAHHAGPTGRPALAVTVSRCS